MKVYALLFKSTIDGLRLPVGLGEDGFISFDATRYNTYLEKFPDAWFVYEFELDEKDLCDT